MHRVEIIIYTFLKIHICEKILILELPITLHSKGKRFGKRRKKKSIEGK